MGDSNGPPGWLVLLSMCDESVHALEIVDHAPAAAATQSPPQAPPSYHLHHSHKSSASFHRQLQEIGYDQ